MKKKLNIDDITMNSMVGAGSRVTGSITTSGLMRIDGDIDGDVTVDGRIIMGDNARIRGNVRARSILIGGIICGDVIAEESVAVLSTGMVVGSIITTVLTVADNVILHGFCSATGDVKQFEKAEKEYRNKLALQSSGLSQRANPQKTAHM